MAHLLREQRGHLTLVPQGGDVWQITPHGVAGVLWTPRRRLVVRPGVPTANLPWLLGLREVSASASGVGAEPLLELVAQALAERLDETAALGLHRAYRERATVGPTLTGAFDAVAQMRASVQQRGVLHGLADDLSVSVLCNQVPAQVARGLVGSALLSESTRARLRAALVAWQDVSDIRLSADVWHSLDREMIPARYGPLLQVCRALVATQGGAGAGWLISLDRVWEGHLERLTRHALQGSPWECHAQRSFEVCPALQGQPGVRLRPDLVVLAGERVVLPLDAKWKRLGEGAVVTEDFYQALAYAAGLGCAEAWLIYPGRRRAWDFPLGGVTVRVRSVPIAGPLTQCERAARRLGREIRRELRRSRGGGRA